MLSCHGQQLCKAEGSVLTLLRSEAMVAASRLVSSRQRRRVSARRHLGDAGRCHFFLLSSVRDRPSEKRRSLRQLSTLRRSPTPETPCLYRRLGGLVARMPTCYHRAKLLCDVQIFAARLRGLAGIALFARKSPCVARPGDSCSS